MRLFVFSICIIQSVLSYSQPSLAITDIVEFTETEWVVSSDPLIKYAEVKHAKIKLRGNVNYENTSSKGEEI